MKFMLITKTESYIIFLDGILFPYLSPVWLIIVSILIKIPLKFLTTSQTLIFKFN